MRMEEKKKEENEREAVEGVVHCLLSLDKQAVGQEETKQKANGWIFYFPEVIMTPALFLTLRSEGADSLILVAGCDGRYGNQEGSFSSAAS